MADRQIALQSVAISDFRSIQGSIAIPLDGPIVLLHGLNGVGKTSVLSAIELALTGEVPAMRRLDPNYGKHLVHHGSSSARIALAVSDNATGVSAVHETLVVAGGRVQGGALLKPSQRQFFSERCYLAQATLSQLLEIYQDAKPREDSPLTRFVKEVLGIDVLDNLVDGLHAAGDIRNVRNLAGAYRSGEEEVARLSGELVRSRSRHNEVSSRLTTLEREASESLREAHVDQVPNWKSEDEVRVVLESLRERSGEPELERLVGLRREVASLEARAAGLLRTDSDFAAAETAAAASSSAADQWRDSSGRMLETHIDGLRMLYPELSSVAASDPELAYRAALDRVRMELRRCSEAVETDDSVVRERAEAVDAFDVAASRLITIEEQLSEVTGDLAGLSRVLADLVPHIVGETCPVCRRDFSEVSSEPLGSWLLERVEGFNANALRVSSLADGRREAELERDRSAAVIRRADASRLSASVRAEFVALRTMLAGQEAALMEAEHTIQAGMDAIRRLGEARRDLARLRAESQTVADVDLRLGELAEALDVPLRRDEPLGDSLRRLSAVTSDRWQVLEGQRGPRLRSIEQIEEHLRLREELAHAASEVAELTERSRAAARRVTEAGTVRVRSRAVQTAASGARADIIGSVFNATLNRVWRDLFVRLAPTEPFVPAFQVPEGSGHALTARLETVHASGEHSGQPGTMLSSGNLNTAALTLFLALHFSAGTRLPWLVLDDPVQSMDDVHIAQLAALLRTITKVHDRNAIVAVHDRALFEYLVLELSPAFPGDRLITVELGRSRAGETSIHTETMGWVEDNALSARSA